MRLWPNRFAFAALVVLAAALPARGWNGTGHQAISQIAWRNLKPQVRTRIAALVGKHPYFERHLQPAEMAADAPDYAMRSFMLASTWPDLLRQSRDPKERQYHHAEWHYVNIPIIPEGTDRSVLEIPPIELKLEDDKPPQNIAQALEWNVRRVKDAGVSDADKAVALAWVLHLVGDVHQPLHACAVYSADYPAGDRGGNLFMIKYHGNVTDLHTFWDEVLGRYVAPKLLDQVTAKVLEENPRERFAEQLKVTGFEHWIDESFAIAKNVTYLGGKLKGVTRAASVADKSGNGVPELPEGYDVKAREMARARIALAGYRLADLLNSIFE
jgi:S1/P1 Nuclease